MCLPNLLGGDKLDVGIARISSGRRSNELHRSVLSTVNGASRDVVEGSSDGLRKLSVGVLNGGDLFGDNIHFSRILGLGGTDSLAAALLALALTAAAHTAAADKSADQEDDTSRQAEDGKEGNKTIGLGAFVALLFLSALSINQVLATGLGRFGNFTGLLDIAGHKGDDNLEERLSGADNTADAAIKLELVLIPKRQGGGLGLELRGVNGKSLWQREVVVGVLVLDQDAGGLLQNELDGQIVATGCWNNAQRNAKEVVVLRWRKARNLSTGEELLSGSEAKESEQGYD